MKKITTILGSSHSEFDRQIKETLNDISEAIEKLSMACNVMMENQNKLFLKQHADVMKSALCDACSHKAYFTTINLNEGTYQSFCNDCLRS